MKCIVRYSLGPQWKRQDAWQTEREHLSLNNYVFFVNFSTRWWSGVEWIFFRWHRQYCPIIEFDEWKGNNSLRSHTYHLLLLNVEPILFCERLCVPVIHLCRTSLPQMGVMRLETRLLALIEWQIWKQNPLHKGIQRRKHTYTQQEKHSNEMHGKCNILRSIAVRFA